MKNNDVRYKISMSAEGVVDTLTGMHIPMARGNRHWQEFEAWMEHEVDASPAPSMLIDDFKEAKMPIIKIEYDTAVLKGCKCKSGIVYDCTFDSVLSLMGILGVAELLKKKKIKVRDFDNEVHNLKIEDYKKDVMEVAAHHQKLIEKKWKAQEGASGNGYTSFKKKELESFKNNMLKMREGK